MIQTCGYCAFHQIYSMAKQEEKRSLGYMLQPVVQNVNDQHALSLKDKRVSRMSCDPKMRKTLRAVGFVTLPLSLPGLALLALAAIPLHLAAQDQEIEKLLCPECRLKSLEPKNPLLNSPQKIIKKIPKLLKFIFRDEKSKTPCTPLHYEMAIPNDGTA